MTASTRAVSTTPQQPRHRPRQSATVEVPAAVDEFTTVEVSAAETTISEEPLTEGGETEAISEVAVEEAGISEPAAAEVVEAITEVNPIDAAAEETTASIVEETITTTVTEETPTTVADVHVQQARRSWFGRFTDEVKHVTDDVVEWVEGATHTSGPTASTITETETSAVAEQEAVSAADVSPSIEETQATDATAVTAEQVPVSAKEVANGTLVEGGASADAERARWRDVPKQELQHAHSARQRAQRKGDSANMYRSVARKRKRPLSAGSAHSMTAATRE
ncbi:hypothetical protein CERSUDRAFT_76247 [Gelatoporia subvermispora B]|uniref:Uncharacterized protein n=1 Tax=Ceriporiopsis subvermispora (strain B) TaxID=914234 RepID=M2R5D2_CERS8|nr:hypothetical protein CERSUDRAFT_76247 [Gelatoporia subvermispora B]